MKGCKSLLMILGILSNLNIAVSLVEATGSPPLSAAEYLDSGNDQLHFNGGQEAISAATPLFDQLPSELWTRIGRWMGVDDLWRLKGSSKGLDASNPVNVRMLYAQFNPKQERVPLVSLYLFCLEREKILIPKYFPSVTVCLDNVDVVSEQPTKPSDQRSADAHSRAKLAVIYHYIDQAMNNQMLLKPLPLQNFNPSMWSEHQRLALLYYASLSHVGRVSGMFDAIWTRFCEKSFTKSWNLESSSLSENYEFIPRECRYSLVNLHYYYRNETTSFPVSRLTELAKNHAWKLDQTKLKALQDELCSYSRQSGPNRHEKYQRVVLNALEEGGNVQPDCVRAYVMNRIGSRPYINPENPSSVLPSQLMNDIFTRTRRYDQIRDIPGDEAFLRKLLQYGFAMNYCGKLFFFNSIPAVHSILKLPLLKLLLDEGGSMLPCRTSSVASPLVEAAYAGQVDLVQLFLSYGAEPDTISFSGSLTPLMVTQSAEVAQLLLDYGADVNAKTDAGKSPLRFAIQRVALAYTSWLLDHGVNLYDASLNGRIPLTDARSTDMLRLLLDRDANQLNIQDIHGRTALHIFSELNGPFVNPELVLVLLHYGADVHAQDSMGRTALFYAHNADVVHHLIEKGHARIDQTDFQGNTPLIFAAISNNEVVVRTLIAFGADVFRKNADGKAVLDIIDVPPYTPEREKIVHVLTLHAASVYMQERRRKA